MSASRDSDKDCHQQEILPWLLKPPDGLACSVHNIIEIDYILIDRSFCAASLQLILSLPGAGMTEMGRGLAA